MANYGDDPSPGRWMKGEIDWTDEGVVNTMGDLKSKTLIDLRKMRDDLSQQRDKLKAKQLPIIAEIDRKAAEEKAVKMMARLSEPERRALLQQLKPLGVISAEVVGEPGK